MSKDKEEKKKAMKEYHSPVKKKKEKVLENVKTASPLSSVLGSSGPDPA